MPKLTPPTIKEYEMLLNVYKQHALSLFRAATADQRLLMEGLTNTNIYQISMSRIGSTGCPLGRPNMTACPSGDCVPSGWPCMTVLRRTSVSGQSAAKKSRTRKAQK
jgi:hypothetical protein